MKTGFGADPADIQPFVIPAKYSRCAKKNNTFNTQEKRRKLVIQFIIYIHDFHKTITTHAGR